METTPQSEPVFTNVNETNETPQPIQPQAAEPTPTPGEPEKKKRGRPKKAEAKEPTFEKPKDAGSIFDDIKKEVEANEQSLNQLNTANGTPGESSIHTAAKNIVDGYMLLTLMDTFFPMILKVVYKKASKLKDKQIQLSKDQKEHLEPIADEISQQLLSFMDPVSLFFIMAGAMYWQNTSEALENAK
jgi:hypothetical protein